MFQRLKMSKKGSKILSVILFAGGMALSNGCRSETHEEVKKKTHFLKQVCNLFAKRPGLSSLTLGAVMAGVSYPLLKKYSDSQK